MRLSPKEWILTSAWDSDGCGFGVSALMKRLEIGPMPSLMSGNVKYAQRLISESYRRLALLKTLLASLTKERDCEEVARLK